MAGKPGAGVIDAWLAVLDEDISRHAAALRFGISPITMYKSRLRIAWQAATSAAQKKALRRELVTLREQVATRQTKGT